MTVEVTESISEAYFPDGSAVEFPFNFKVDSISQVVVVNANGEPIPNSLYSVLLNEEEGGIITFATAPTTIEYPIIFVASEPDFTQTREISNTGPGFNPKAIEAALDEAATRDIYLRDQLIRAVKVPFGEEGFSFGSVDDGDVLVRSGSAFVGAPKGSFPAGPTGPTYNVYTELIPFAAQDVSNIVATLVINEERTDYHTVTTDESGNTDAIESTSTQGTYWVPSSQYASVPELSVAYFGAANDGSAGQFPAIETAANSASRIIRQAIGGATGVAGPALIFDHGEYDFEGNMLTLPNYVNPVTRGGGVIIRNGGFRWETTYGNKVENFIFIDPPVKEATITSITAANPPVVTATAHGFATGDFVRIEDVVGGRVCNTRGYRITVVDVDSFELIDADYTSAPVMTGGKAYCGAAIEFDTNNIARSTFEVNNCVCYGTEGAGQAFVSGREFNQTRSTQLTVSNCVTAQIDRIIHSTCDSLVARGGFYWSSRDGSSAFFVKGKGHALSTVLIPRLFGADTYWTSYEVGEDLASNGLAFNSVRFSGEGGGCSVVAVLSTSNDLLSGSNLNVDTISFNDCIITSRKGGPSGTGGIVVLRSNGAGASHCPNAITFSNCDVNMSSTAGDFVLAEADEPPALTEGYNFQIGIDTATFKICERSSIHPVADNLLTYLNTMTREHMKARTQTLTGGNLDSGGIDILKGSKVKLVSGGTERSITEVVNFKIGDDLTLIAETGTSVIWRVPHEDGTATTAFHNVGDTDIDPSAPEIHKFVAESATRFVEVG